MEKWKEMHLDFFKVNSALKELQKNVYIKPSKLFQGTLSVNKSGPAGREEVGSQSINHTELQITYSLSYSFLYL